MRGYSWLFCAGLVLNVVHQRRVNQGKENFKSNRILRLFRSNCFTDRFLVLSTAFVKCSAAKRATSSLEKPKSLKFAKMEESKLL